MSLPPPVGGLNSRDALANMDNTDAIVLDNWFPMATSVDVRAGYSSHATFTGACETVITYNGLSANKLFVALNTTNDAIVDATSGGAISTPVVGGATPTVQALTNARFDYVNYGTTGGQFLLLVNGADTPLEYDGSTWSASTTTGGTPANYFTVAVFAERVWYGVKDSFDVYYLPVRAKSGAGTRLNLGSLFKLGGYLSNIVTVTDSTADVADYICFVSSQGEVIAFEGDDPSSASNWFKAAHFVIGRPVCKGNRAWCKAGADALVVCTDGVVSLRRAIATDRAENSQSVSDKIRSNVNADVRTHGSRFGWSLTLHPAGQKLILNVPTAEGSTSRQWVMNSETKAWCRFTGWNAFSWAVQGDSLYWGGSGVLARADYTAKDGSASITADAKQAFNYFGGRGRTTQVQLVRPVLALNGALQFGVAVDSDYEDGGVPSLTSVQGTSADPWGGVWSVAWAQASSMYREWFTVTGEGFALAPRVRAIANDVTLSWSATDYVYDTSPGPGL
jgi:hypothetical protein